MPQPSLRAIVSTDPPPPNGADGRSVSFARSMVPGITYSSVSRPSTKTPLLFGKLSTASSDSANQGASPGRKSKESEFAQRHPFLSFAPFDLNAFRTPSVLYRKGLSTPDLAHADLSTSAPRLAEPTFSSNPVISSASPVTGPAQLLPSGALSQPTQSTSASPAPSASMPPPRCPSSSSFFAARRIPPHLGSATSRLSSLLSQDEMESVGDRQARNGSGKESCEVVDGIERGIVEGGQNRWID